MWNHNLRPQCRVEMVEGEFDLGCVMLPAPELCPEAALHQWCSSQQGGQCVQLLLALGQLPAQLTSAGIGCVIVE